MASLRARSRAGQTALARGRVSERLHSGLAHTCTAILLTWGECRGATRGDWHSRQTPGHGAGGVCAEAPRGAEGMAWGANYFQCLAYGGNLVELVRCVFQVRWV